MQPSLETSLSWPWRLALVATAIGGIAVALLCAAEPAGVVPRDALLRGAGDGERWAGLAVGLLLQPFAWTAIRHGRLRIDRDGVHYLGLGVLCCTRSIPFASVRRWGTAVATNRGRRERHLAFELHDGSVPSLKLAMYAGAAQVLDALTQRLGTPSPASATIGGIRFDTDL